MTGMLIKKIPQGLTVHFSKHMNVSGCVLNQAGLNETTPESILANALLMPGVDEFTWAFRPEDVCVIITKK